MTSQSAPSDAFRAGLATRYRIERELGAGGMAVVYLARDLARERDVALKVLRPELGAAAGAERFEREIRLAAGLVHPNILPVLDSGETDARLWYTMPFVDGESLRARLDREKQLPLEDAVRLTREIADALDQAHRRGILHRDIKPENILLAAGHALVADFGIARAIATGADRLTSTGIALGTPGYMSPEQSSGETQLDARSDLYALASVSYEMLAGEPPFTGPTAQAIIARRMSQPPPSLRTTRPNVSPAVDAVLRRALAPVPADRFTTVAEFAGALTAAATVSGRARSFGPGGRWLGRAALAAGLLLVGGIAYRLVSGRLAAPLARASDGGTIRLAVLPFRLLSADSADRYLAAGISEEVTSALANLSGLRVIDPSSVVPFASRGKTAREIGAALSADGLIDGEVQKAGDAVRIRVRLVEPGTEEAKWSQSWDHSASEVFQIQSEVAKRVAGVLRIQLAERESHSLSRPPTTNPSAYDAYLRARAFGRMASLRTGRRQTDSIITELRRAVALDSTFARAWGTLATELVSSVFLFDADPVNLDRADEAIRRALALDSSVAIAWKARSDLAWNARRGWHFAQALADARHAIATQPSLATAHAALGSLLFHYGFTAEARRELAASLSLDPRDGCDDLSRCTGFSRPRLARVLWYEQKFDSALAVYRQMPFIGGFVWEMAVALNGAGRPAEGLRVLDSVRSTTESNNSDREAVRALLTASLGREAEALGHIRAAIDRSVSQSHFHHAQFTIACAYARLGRKADAVDWLRRTAANGMPNYPLFRDDINLRSLQQDPAYQALMADLAREFETNRKIVGSS
jgi:serine/threonine-protein kinase